MKQKFIDISILGSKKLQRDLNKMGTKVGKKIVRQALRQEQKVVAQIAKSKAPVDTGAHRRNIKVKAATNLNRGFFGIAVVTGTREQLGIGTDYKTSTTKDPGYYPIVLEKGGKTKSGRIIRAIPHLGPAFDSRRNQALKNVADFIRRQIDALWKGR